MSDFVKKEDAIRICKMCASAKYRVPYIEQAFENISTIDAVSEWIPCSERLPEIGQKVLASTKKTVFTQVFKGYHSDPKRWAWEHNNVKTIEAWMPIPEPWKGTDDE